MQQTVRCKAGLESSSLAPAFPAFLPVVQAFLAAFSLRDLFVVKNKKFCTKVACLGGIKLVEKSVGGSATENRDIN